MCYSPLQSKNVKEFKLTFKLPSGEERTAKTTNWDDKGAYEREAPEHIPIYYQGKRIDGEMIVEVQNV